MPVPIQEILLEKRQAQARSTATNRLFELSAGSRHEIFPLLEACATQGR